MIISQHLGINDTRFSGHFVANLDTGKGNAPLSGVPGISLPRVGRSTGRKTRRLGRGIYPKKETLKLWAQFITDNFEDGDEPAGPQVFQRP